MVVGAKVCDLTEDLLWFVCGLCLQILTSPLTCRSCFLFLSQEINKILSNTKSVVQVICISVAQHGM